MRLRQLLLSLGAVVLLVIVDGCGPTEADRAAVHDWLTCDGCTRGAPGSVAALFTPTAVPLLEDALFRLPVRIRADAEADLRAAWALIPQPSQDEDTFVTFYVTSLEAGVQRRAVIALSDLGKEGILIDARTSHDQGLIQFRDDVLRELDRAIAYNTIGLVPVDPAMIEIVPPGLTLPVGQSAHVMAVVRDASGAELSSALVSWSSSNTGTVRVTADPPYAAVVTGLDNGSADLRAETSNGVEALANVVVDPLATRMLTRVSGDAQTDTVGHVVTNPLVIRVDGSSGPLGGVQVTWTVLIGDATFVGSGSRTLTRNTDGGTGLSGVEVQLGNTPGSIQVRVEIAEDTETFTARAVN